MHGQHHLLQAVGIAVRCRGGWLCRVLRHVTGSQGDVFDEADVNDVAVAGGDVPFSAEVLLLEVGGVEE